ncbi:hypothetical protein JL720_12983 [Aureococcus anophagefferens]|nr:hypothetical protein JL720_12983 [Aureococcus anophagefferens]
MKSILRLAAVVLLSINPIHAGKKYCEKKGSTEADCLALKAGKKGKEKKKCKKCKGKKGKAKEKCEGKDSK